MHTIATGRVFHELRGSGDSAPLWIEPIVYGAVALTAQTHAGAGEDQPVAVVMSDDIFPLVDVYHALCCEAARIDRLSSASPFAVVVRVRYPTGGWSEARRGVSEHALQCLSGMSSDCILAIAEAEAERGRPLGWRPRQWLHAGLRRWQLRGARPVTRVLRPGGALDLPLAGTLSPPVG